MAINEGGGALEYLSEGFKNNKEIVMMAIKNGVHFLEYASEELKNDRDIIQLAISLSTIIDLPIEHFSKEFQDDKDIVMATIDKNAHSFEYASKRLRADKEVVLAAINIIPGMLFYANTQMQNDKDLLKILKMGEKRIHGKKKIWFQERMEVLKTLEESEWMENNMKKNILKNKRDKF
jgi:hypothetical protein